MPTISATLDIQSSIPSPEIFRLDVEIQAFVGFPDGSLLVLRASDDQFDRVATLYDLATWPTSSTPGQEFYRQTLTQIDYTSLHESGQAKQDIVDRVAALVDQYAEYALYFTTNPYHETLSASY